MKEIRRLVYLLLNLFLCYCTFGNKYGYNNLVITNYDKSKMTFRMSDGNQRSYGELFASYLPRNLRSSNGMQIECTELTLDGKTGNIVYKSTVNGTKPERSYSSSLNTFDKNTKELISRSLVSLTDQKGRVMKGILIEISPNFKQIAITSGVNTYDKTRLVYHIDIQSLSKKSKDLLFEKFSKRYDPLLQISRQIIEANIKFYIEKQKFDPVDEEEEMIKFNQSKTAREEILRKNSIIESEYEKILSAWEYEVRRIKLSIDDDVRRLESLYSDLYQDLLTYQNEGTRLNNLFNNIRLPDLTALGGGSQLPEVRSEAQRKYRELIREQDKYKDNLMIAMSNNNRNISAIKTRRQEVLIQINTLKNSITLPPKPKSPNYFSVPALYTKRISWLVYLAAEKAALAKIPKEPASLIKLAQNNTNTNLIFLATNSTQKTRAKGRLSKSNSGGANSVEGTYKVKLNLRGSGYSSSRMIGELKLYLYSNKSGKFVLKYSSGIDRKGNSTNVFYECDFKYAIENISNEASRNINIATIQTGKRNSGQGADITDFKFKIKDTPGTTKQELEIYYGNQLLEYNRSRN